jgi:hypothetical protein
MSKGSMGGGSKLMRNGTPGQFTDPFPLINIESPHLEKRISGANKNIEHCDILQRINISSNADVMQLLTGKVTPVRKHYNLRTGSGFHKTIKILLGIRD